MTNIDSYTGKYYKIVDKRNNKILAEGKVPVVKVIPEPLISFDFEYFFSIKDNEYFNIIETNEAIDIPFNPDIDIPIALYRDIETSKDCYIFKEYTIKELDEEIKDLVYVLNDLGYVTVGSCCGHGNSNAWITIFFYDFESLNKLTKIINHKFKDKFFLRTYYKISNSDTNCVSFNLETYNIGEEAYNDINELTNYLKLVLETKND